MKTPWHQRTWIVAALVIFFFPIGLILAWKHPAWPKAAKWVATALAVIIAIGLYVDKDETVSLQTEVETESSLSEPAKTTVSARQGATSEGKNQEHNKSQDQVSYDVAGDLEDTSYGDVKRVSWRIVIPLGRSRAELRATLEKAARDLVLQTNADAAMVFAYRPQDSPSGAYTVGRAVIAPNGRWEDASSSEVMETKIDLNELYFVPLTKEEAILPRTDTLTREGLQQEEYTLSVKGVELSNGRVQLNVKTNIPGVIELMAGVSLAHQAPDDVFIGTSERISVRNGLAQTILDVSDLPSGEYEVEAAFYPRWGFQDERSRATGISIKIESKHLLFLDGSGESVESVSRRNDGQKWVMENVSMGMDWDSSYWINKFDVWEEFPVTTMNPDIIKNYYFESIDMTLVINTLKNEIVTWRIGHDGL